MESCTYIIGRLLSSSLASLTLLLGAICLSAAPSMAQPQMPNFDDYNDRFREFHLTSAKGNWQSGRRQMESKPEKSAKDAAQSYEMQAGKLKPQAKIALTRGLEHSYRRQYLQSVPCFDQVLATSPHYWPALLERADALQNAGKFAEAAAGLSVLIKDQPKNWFAIVLRSYCYFQLKQYEKGIQDCNTAIAIEPKNPRPYRSRAQAYRILHRDAEAKADLEFVRRYEMPWIAKDLIAGGRFSEALNVLNQFVAENPKDPMGYDHRSYLLIAMGKHKEAVSDCTKFMEYCVPMKAHGCSLRAKAYDNLGEYEKAVEDYAYAIKTCDYLVSHKPPAKPDRAQLLFFNQAMMIPYLPSYLKQEAIDNIKLKRFAAAIVDCNRLVSMNKKSADYYSLRGDAYAAWGKNKEALSDYKAAISLNPKNDYFRQQAKDLENSTRR